MKARSLALRITVMLGVLCLVVLGSGSLVMDWRGDREFEDRFEQSLLTEAQALIEAIRLGPDTAEDDATWLPSGVLRSEGRHYFEALCSDRIVATSHPPPPIRPAGWPSRGSARPLFGSQHEDATGEHLGWLIMDFRAAAPGAAAQNCRLLLIQHRTKLDEIMLAIDWILILSPLTVLGIALIAAPLVVRRGLRPLNALGERMRDIGPNAPGNRLAPTGLKELDPLVERFNGVLARMDEGLARERQFASGLAHETRTRLAELRTLTEVEALYPSGRPLPDILGELNRIGAELEATVTALLLLTRLQGGLEQPQLQELDLQLWLEQLVRRHRPAAQARGVELRLAIGHPGHWRSDPALLEVVIGNLLANACAYAPAGDTVNFRADGGELAIGNAAPDLGDDDLAHFGQRFWRKQQPHSAHAGLGLALAAAAAQAQGLELGYRLEGGRLHCTVRCANS